ncbi:hypothetical protein BN1323_10013 [Staphylococcus aureus]|nr:hypothetical protein BN1323_10013 [Staphylococcus aureus]
MFPICFLLNAILTNNLIILVFFQKYSYIIITIFIQQMFVKSSLIKLIDMTIIYYPINDYKNFFYAFISN